MAHRSLGLRPAVPGLRLVLARARWLGIGVAPWLAARLLAERERWLLWLPVALGVGIGLYFALPREPPVWLGPALLLLVGLVWLVRRAHRGAGEDRAWRLAAALALAAIATGMSAASIRTHLVAAPVLERRGAHVVEGQVLLVEDQTRGARLTLGELRIEGLDPGATPAELRVSLRSATPAVRPGDRVRLRAFLMPPSPPSEPAGYDFARQAYFSQLGAVGYGLGKLERVAAAQTSTWRLGLARVRQRVASAIQAAVPGPPGAVAVALMTGLRGGITEAIWRDMQIAGIAHLLAISGLHLGLVAGTLFFGVRVALALVPPLALRVPTKKVAAGLALLGAFGYLLLSGATVPTQRAFIMTALMLLAVMVDRNPFSMRTIAWAALVVLLCQPESLLGASFQMSFAAVVALIATYETGVARRPDHASGLDTRLVIYIGGVALTTLIASLATAPLAIYHFGRLPTYGILANLIAVPLTAFWIMPLGLAGLLLLPLGLGGGCFALMGRGIEVMLAVAATIAGWPASALLVAKPSVAALTVTLLGGLWLCLWRGSWRRLGVLGVALGGAAHPDLPAAGSADRRARPDRRGPARCRPPGAVALATRPLDHRRLAAHRGSGGSRALAGGGRRRAGRPQVRCRGLRAQPQRPQSGARPAPGGAGSRLRARGPGAELPASGALPQRRAADRTQGAVCRRWPCPVAGLRRHPELERPRGPRRSAVDPVRLQAADADTTGSPGSGARRSVLTWSRYAGAVMPGARRASGAGWPVVIPSGSTPAQTGSA